MPDSVRAPQVARCLKSARSPAVRILNSRTPARLLSISRPSELEWASRFVAALEETESCSKRSLWAQDEGLEAVAPGHPRKRGLLALTSVASRYCECPAHWKRERFRSESLRKPRIRWERLAL